ncbi:ChaN family lipoprotein [Sphingobacterium corticis]|uniref:ChaN family lipoprotein n=1 Tax=Sphingobacterium corticis TaxID=1812823 RepID=A0ABW5NID4_9SPHI
MSLQMAHAQNISSLYNAQGKVVSIEDVLGATKGKKYIFIGEMHGEKPAHDLELQVLESLFALHGDKLVLGMEMFETDVQPVLNEYMSGIINTRSFESESRIWTNYSDYRPMVEFAKAHRIPVIATNVPRRYANAVYHRGVAILDSLSDYAKTILPPLPMNVDTTLSSYQELKNMIPGHGGENMLYSQAIKDASMAHQILLHAKVDKIFLHINGAYHTKNREGILSFMREIDPKLILTITTIPEGEDNPSVEEADFTLIIPSKPLEGTPH